MTSPESDKPFAAKTSKVFLCGPVFEVRRKHKIEKEEGTGYKVPSIYLHKLEVLRSEKADHSYGK